MRMGQMNEAAGGFSKGYIMTDTSHHTDAATKPVSFTNQLWVSDWENDLRMDLRAVQSCRKQSVLYYLVVARRRVRPFESMSSFRQTCFVHSISFDCVFLVSEMQARLHGGDGDGVVVIASHWLLVIAIIAVLALLPDESILDFCAINKALLGAKNVLIHAARVIFPGLILLSYLQWCALYYSSTCEACTSHP